MKGKRRFMYDVKTVEWHEPERATLVSLMMVKFKHEGNRVLNDAGYEGENIMFISIQPGAEAVHWKPREFAKMCGATKIKWFLIGLYSWNEERDTPSWDELEDGERYTPDIYGE